MPQTRLRNLVYRAALPLLAPPVGGRTRLSADGAPFQRMDRLQRILTRHHVLGSVTLLRAGEREALLCASVQEPAHDATPDTIFRVASLTKMATAAVVLKLCGAGKLSPEDRARDILPGADRLGEATVRQLLSHTSGLRDHPAADRTLREGQPYPVTLAQLPDPAGERGTFHYCNLGFGLMGSIIETVTGESVEACFQRVLFQPLGMRATLSAVTLDERAIMPISRVLPYHPGQDVRIPPLGRQPLTVPDPLRHYGYTAGSLYTDARSVAILLDAIRNDPQLRPMRETQADYGALSPTLHYGLGLLIVRDPRLGGEAVYGHQGYAYGCVDGAFFSADGRTLVHLNGGASEARTGRLGLLNRDLIRWAWQEEFPVWT